MSAVTSNEHSPLLAHYDAGLAYDELLDRQRRPRAHYQALYDRLLSLPADELNRRKSAADVSFLNQGITFTVYSSSEGTERIFPYDLIPRIITGSEWETVEQGLSQRLTALNLFLRDIYHDGKIIKNGVVPVDMVYSSRRGYRSKAGRLPNCWRWTSRTTTPSPIMWLWRATTPARCAS